MSMAADFGYDAYDADDIRGWRERNNFPKDKDGKRHCKNCGSANLKTSKQDNLYCGDLCWVEDPNTREKGKTA